MTLNTIEEKMLELERRRGTLADGLFDPGADVPLDITANHTGLPLAAQ